MLLLHLSGSSHHFCLMCDTVRWAESGQETGSLLLTKKYHVSGSLSNPWTVQLEVRGIESRLGDACPECPQLLLRNSIGHCVGTCRNLEYNWNGREKRVPSTAVCRVQISPVTGCFHHGHLWDATNLNRL